MKIALCVVGFFAVLWLSGCATMGDNQAKKQLFNSTIPVCHSEQECAAKWGAAQIWVAQNCGMKIQICTDSIIETYNSTSMRLAARVIKEPAGGGTYRILIRTWCGNIFGCSPNAWNAAINFNRYVGSLNE